LEDVGWCHRVLLLSLSSLGMCAMHANILEQRSLIFPPRSCRAALAEAVLSCCWTCPDSARLLGMVTPIWLLIQDTTICVIVAGRGPLVSAHRTVHLRGQLQGNSAGNSK
ncbi:hypothetical protein COO60DRAFT_1508177, partial [Scenedesmus sp. NREL 46B-D3]